MYILKSFKYFVLSHCFFLKDKSHNVQSITNNINTMHKHNIKSKVTQAMALFFWNYLMTIYLLEEYQLMGGDAEMLK